MSTVSALHWTDWRIAYGLSASYTCWCAIKQEALMLTNPRYAFRGQSRSPNLVPFLMLGITSCAIVTLRRAVFFRYSTSKMSWSRNPCQRSLAVIESGTILYIGCGFQCSIETLFVKRTVFEIFDFENAVTLKTVLGVRQGDWKCHCSIERIRLSVEWLYLVSEILECLKMSWPWNRGHRSLKVIESCTIR